MLVLSLKKGDKIQIGRDIQISLVELHSGRVRLGIEAPEEYHILRDELLQEQKKKRSHKPSSTDFTER